MAAIRRLQGGHGHLDHWHIEGTWPARYSGECGQSGVDRDRFLRLGTITHGGVDCTVGDIIDVVAHAFGGVHYGQLLSDGNRALAVLEKEVLIDDESMVLHSLHDIGKVTVKALIPLAEAILTRQNMSDSAAAHATTP